MSQPHPLSPLSASEVQVGISLLRAMDGHTLKTRVISLMLWEPSKAAVFAWPDGPAISREAIAILFDNGPTVPLGFI